MSIRESFVAKFGEDQAVAIEKAAQEHRNGINDERIGSDSFRWAITLSIGYECWLKEDYREYHGITASASDIKQWIKDEAHLEDHDGSVDYLGLICGVYNEYMPEGIAMKTEGCC